MSFLLLYPQKQKYRIMIQLRESSPSTLSGIAGGVAFVGEGAPGFFLEGGG